jgi:hypothetical protein
MVRDRSTLLFGGLITPCHEALVAERETRRSRILEHTCKSPFFSESDASLLPAVDGVRTAGSDIGEMVGLVVALPGFSILCLDKS